MTLEAINIVKIICEFPKQETKALVQYTTLIIILARIVLISMKY